MNIAEYLAHARLSPEAFGELIGHDGTTVRRWLNGGDVKGSDILNMVAKTGKLIDADAVMKAIKKRAA
jgi:hypothetical protein